ncbi:3-oxoacyl-[acyl-carrier protein] reductase [hydrothermal vent metagenome]|uniref:3-oxoacyl-[acyl-carrier protein] reductase n=1 Tax=hydrothermal vent metagenome TaxID=652676 RepID=A0A3B0RU17_9ZZZZ
MKHKNRIAIVTGSAQGIGAAIARKLSSEGASVVIADINGEGAAEVAASLPDALAVTVDTSSEDQVNAMVDACISRFGKVDILVNNAAIVPFTEWDDIDFAEWRRIMSVNLDGVFLTSHAVYPHMRDAAYGRIVNIASNVFVAGTPNLAHYVASKGGVVGFTRALATELGKYGITVNAVAPGLTETEGTIASPHAEAFDFVQSLQAIPRRGLATDIAPAVAFLTSEEAAWVTGSLLVVDGGHTRH